MKFEKIYQKSKEVDGDGHYIYERRGLASDYAVGYMEGAEWADAENFEEMKKLREAMKHNNNKMRKYEEQNANLLILTGKQRNVVRELTRELAAVNEAKKVGTWPEKSVSRWKIVLMAAYYGGMATMIIFLFLYELLK